MANTVWFQGMEHGWIPRAVARRQESEPRRRRFDLSEWTPWAILARGGDAGRDDERLYGDLQAARDARADGR